MKKNLLPLLLSFVFLTGCQLSGEHPLFVPSPAQPGAGYTSFEEYIEQAQDSIAKQRYFLTEQKQKEIKANAPFEIKPEDNLSPGKGVLLVHGLGDSPYSFVDIADELAKKGLLVRTILLPGHGTRPGDMLRVDADEWLALLEKQVSLLKEQVDDVYLGGFSTGGNLVYTYAAGDPEIKGLMLFSPGFVSNERFAFLAPVLSPFRPWLIKGSPDNQTNYTRYRMVPTNGFAQYYRTSKYAMAQLAKKPFDRPVFMVLTEHDSVLDTLRIKELFNQRFTNPDSHLIWFGANPTARKGRIRYINSRVPELSISNMSHMGVLFAPDNPYYGVNGSERICRNGMDQTDEDIAACKAGAPVWFSAWDGRVGDQFHARLTFNPEFVQMMEDIDAVFNF